MTRGLLRAGFSTGGPDSGPLAPPGARDLTPDTESEPGPSATASHHGHLQLIREFTPRGLLLPWYAWGRPASFPWQTRAGVAFLPPAGSSFLGTLGDARPASPGKPGLELPSFPPPPPFSWSFASGRFGSDVVTESLALSALSRVRCPGLSPSFSFLLLFLPTLCLPRRVR